MIPRPIVVPTFFCCRRGSKIEYGTNSDSEYEIQSENESESHTQSESQSNEKNYSWDSIILGSKPNPNQQFYPGDILRFYPSTESERHFLAVITSDMCIHEIVRIDKSRKMRRRNVDIWCESIQASHGDIYINHQRDTKEITFNVKPRDVIRYYPDPSKLEHSTAVVLNDGTICDCNRKYNNHLVKYNSAYEWYRSLPYVKNSAVFINSYSDKIEK